jgi:hypothetical protein
MFLRNRRRYAGRVGLEMKERGGKLHEDGRIMASIFIHKNWFSSNQVAELDPKI